jgi:hypothetical protein
MIAANLRAAFVQRQPQIFAQQIQCNVTGADNLSVAFA